MTGTKTKARTKAAALLNEPEAAPLARPETPAEWVERVTKAMGMKPPPPGAREEYRRLLECYPAVSKDFGDMARLCRGLTATLYESNAVIEEQIRHRAKVMRQELAGETPTPLELLLIDVVIAAHQDYYHIVMLAVQHQKKSVSLVEIDRWERVIASKEQRYVRAIAELARVRRLLNLPAPQVNINLPGGQQVNVSGKP